jgi:hypothetical protein
VGPANLAPGGRFLTMRWRKDAAAFLSQQAVIFTRPTDGAVRARFGLPGAVDLRPVVAPLWRLDHLTHPPGWGGGQRSLLRGLGSMEVARLLGSHDRRTRHWTAGLGATCPGWLWGRRGDLSPRCRARDPARDGVPSVSKDRSGPESGAPPTHMAPVMAPVGVGSPKCPSPLPHKSC